LQLSPQMKFRKLREDPSFMENTLERLGETQCSPRRWEELAGGGLVAVVRWE
jgi:hypothetical protein